MASWETNQLLDEKKYAPIYVVRKAAAPKRMEPKKLKASSREKTGLFRGSLFCFLRISPPDNVVDFNRHKLQDMVTVAGGQTLTTEMVQALRMDKARGVAPRRKCYVVCWGAYQSDEANLAMHPLLAKLASSDW